MSLQTVRISPGSHQLLKALAKETNQSMTETLDQALDAYRRKVFFERLNAGYAQMRGDEAQWAAHQAELKAWDSTLADGLDADERWTDDGRCIISRKKR